MITTLYARSQNGKIKIWKISSDNIGNIIIESGYLGNKLLHTIRKYTYGSIDKELTSRIKNKRREGYKSLEELGIDKEYDNMFSFINTLNNSLPETNLDLNFNLKPNKAVKYRDRKPIYPCFGQPKLNGLRGVIRMENLISGVGLFTNNMIVPTIKTMGGLEYLLSHITENINNLNYNDIDLALDGELYIPGYNLNEIKKAIPMRLDNGTITNVSSPSLTKNVKFYCFDLAIENLSQIDRLKLRNRFLDEKHYLNIIKVPTKIIYNDNEAIEFANQCVRDGYEGAVFRDIYSEYKFGSKTVDMVKLKFFEDQEFIIIDVIPKNKRPDLGMFVCKNDINDSVFTVNPMGTEEQQRAYLSNKDEYINRMVTVKFYERSGVKKVPFHANALAFRDYGE